MGFLNVKLAGFFKYVGYLNTITPTPEFGYHWSYKMQKSQLVWSYIATGWVIWGCINFLLAIWGYTDLKSSILDHFQGLINQLDSLQESKICLK